MSQVAFDHLRAAFYASSCTNFLFYFFSSLLLLPLETHSLAPGQSGGVLLFDVMLQRSPDGDVGFHPVHMHLVPVKTTYDFMASFFFLALAVFLPLLRTHNTTLFFISDFLIVQFACLL